MVADCAFRAECGVGVVIRQNFFGVCSFLGVVGWSLVPG